MKAANLSLAPSAVRTKRAVTNAEALIGRTPNLRAPSASVLKLLNLLKNPDADYDEVVSAVGHDAVLTAKLLALCNSPAYGLAKPMASLNQAVQYLGFCDTLRMVMALSFGSQVGVDLPGYSMEAGSLWKHSLVAAHLAPHVLGLSSIVVSDPSIAYTAGLVHDIGKVVIGQSLDAARHRELSRLLETENASWIDAETEVLGCNHAEVGACLLRQWNIPEVIVEAVANHHDPSLENGPQLSAILHVVDASAHSIGASPGGFGFAVVVREAVLEALRLSAPDLQKLTLAAFEAVEEIASRECPKREPVTAAGNVSLSF